MLLIRTRNAVIYEAGGGICGDVARTFVREGAKVTDKPNRQGD
jgi:hypothetical protein